MRNYNYEIVTDIDYGDIADGKIDEFIVEMKSLHLLSDEDIEYIPGEEPGFWDFEVNVGFSISPGCKGSREYRGGPPIEPDDPPHLEDLEVYVMNGKEKHYIDDYFKDTEETFGEQCWENARD